MKVHDIFALREDKIYRAFIGPTKVGIVFLLGDEKEKCFYGGVIAHDPATGEESKKDTGTIKKTMLEAVEFIREQFPSIVRDFIMWHEEPVDE